MRTPAPAEWKKESLYMGLSENQGNDVTKRVHIYYYGIKSPKTTIRMVFWDPIP